MSSTKTGQTSSRSKRDARRIAKKKRRAQDKERARMQSAV